MTHFITTRMHKSRTTRGRGHKVYKGRLMADKKEFMCCYCSNEFPIENATLEHTLPDIIIRASYGKLKPRNANYKLACKKCNNELSMIPNAIGAILRSPHLSEIQLCSRRLCDLVRKPK